MLYDSKNIINTQRSLYKWFDETQNENSVLSCFKTIIEEFKQNGRIDSGTKITLLYLLKDINSFNFYKLRSVTENNQNMKRWRRNVFFTKLVKLKFDLKLCSAKEFIELLSNIDNCAIKYIQLTTNSTITLRDMEHLTVRNFMGELEATIESSNEKNIGSSEFFLKRLADAVHYRLTKQIPSSDTISGVGTFSNVKVLLQSPPESSFSETSESSFDLSSNISTKCTKNKTSTDLTSTSTSNLDVSSAEYSKNISNSSSSNTLNGDGNSSVLSLSKNSAGSSTPLTSSPLSSTSNSKASFKFNEKSKEKKFTHKKKSFKKSKDQQNANSKTEDKNSESKSDKPKNVENTGKPVKKENGEASSKKQNKKQNTSLKSNNSLLQNKKTQNVEVCN